MNIDVREKQQQQNLKLNNKHTESIAIYKYYVCMYEKNIN